MQQLSKNAQSGTEGSLRRSARLAAKSEATKSEATKANAKPVNIIIVTAENADKYHLHAGDTITIHNQTNNGWFHGKGVSTYENGTRYCGEYVNGNYHGKGKIVYNDGNIYEGEFEKGFRHGKGKLVYANGSSYEGEFANGRIRGNTVSNIYWRLYK